jgi:hypothetical protein
VGAVAGDALDGDVVAGHPGGAVCTLALVQSKCERKANIPVADPSVGDLVVRRVLRTAEIEQQLAAESVALVGVGDRGALSAAVGAAGDGVVDAVDVREAGLDVEVDGGEVVEQGSRELGQGVGGGRAVLGAGLESGGGREGDRGEEDGGESGEQHLEGWVEGVKGWRRVVG